jgi:AcrR family transcriptional regulator
MLVSSSDVPSVGLRERKTIKTRLSIQGHAFRLFYQQGFEATTVREIIEAADVSESTFFRYFATKSDVVLSDGFDPLIVASFRRQSLDKSPIGALRAALLEVFGSLSTSQANEQRERMLLILDVPELRATLIDQFAQNMWLLTEEMGERTGRNGDDMAVRSLAGAAIGVCLAALFALVDNPAADISLLLDEALAHLESGFRAL